MLCSRNLSQWMFYSVFIMLLLSGCNREGIAPSDQNTPTPSPVISFSGDWEQGLRGPGNWGSIQVVAADRFQRVTSPVRQGIYSARVEVRPGDDPSNYPPPAIPDRERAQVLVMTDSAGNELNENEASIGTTRYYAFSVMLNSDWVSPKPDPTTGWLWSSIFGLHGPDKYACAGAFMFEVYDNFSFYLYTGDMSKPCSDSVHKHCKDYDFSDNSLNRGHWIDFVIKIKFEKTFTGTVDIWRRNEGQTNFTKILSISDVPTLQFNSNMDGTTVLDHYYKHGFYRPKQTTITNILWLDGLTVGNTFDVVVSAAFPAP